jgi:hypothetical protein
MDFRFSILDFGLSETRNTLIRNLWFPIENPKSKIQNGLA